MSKFAYLDNFIGRTVKVDRGGPECQEGQLLDVRKHLLVLGGENGVYYYHLDHIKSVTCISSDGHRSRGRRGSDLVRGHSLEEVLANSKYRWVGVNRGGPSKLEGVIDHVKGDSVLVINEHELMTCPIHHIKCVTFDVVEENEEKENKN